MSGRISVVSVQGSFTIVISGLLPVPLETDVEASFCKILGRSELAEDEGVAVESTPSSRKPIVGKWDGSVFPRVDRADSLDLKASKK